MTLDEALVHELKQLENQVAWGLVGEGLRLSVEFGEQVPLKKAIANPHLSEERRNNRGERSLFVLCSWRLRKGSSFAGCYDPEEILKPWLAKLEKARVDAVHVGRFFDLTIHFDGGLIWDVFCDNRLTLDDYDLRTGKRNLSCKRGVVSSEDHE